MFFECELLNSVWFGKDKTCQMEENIEQVLNLMEERVSDLERRVFGDEIDSKIQQKRQIIDEIVQINGQIQRSVTNREVVSQLMKSIEQVLEYLELEESRQLLGGEAKVNAILAAEPTIRRMYEWVKGINLDQVNEAINSEAIRNLASLRGEMSNVKVVQLEQEARHEDLCSRIRTMDDAVSLLGTTRVDNKPS